MKQSKISRRSFLLGLGAVSAAAVLTACGGSSSTAASGSAASGSAASGSSVVYRTLADLRAENPRFLLGTEWAQPIPSGLSQLSAFCFRLETHFPDNKLVMNCYDNAEYLFGIEPFCWKLFAVKSPVTIEQVEIITGDDRQTVNI